MKQQDSLNFVLRRNHVECQKQIGGKRVHLSWPTWEDRDKDLQALFEMRMKGYSLPEFLAQCNTAGNSSLVANIGPKGPVEFERFAQEVFPPHRKAQIQSWDWEEPRLLQFMTESAFKGRQLHTICEDELTSWYKSYSQRPTVTSDNTRGHMAKSIRALFKGAVELEYLRESPALKIKIPKIPNSTSRAYTIGEVVRLYLAADSVLRPWVLFPLYTGLRPPSEVERLTVGKVTLEERRLSIPDGGTRKSRARELYLHDDLMPFIEVAAAAIQNLPLFRNGEGKPAKFPRPAFDRARKAANLPDLTMYQLRHTFKTWLFQTGTKNTEMLDYLMGHSQERMGGRYLHPSLDDAREAIVKLPSILKAVSPQKVQPKVPNGGSEESA